MRHAPIFLYLQVLDFLTTLVGFKMGAVEISPFIRALIHFGPIAGVVASKGLAVLIAGICLRLEKPHLLRRINYWYAGLVLWNICIILACAPCAWIAGEQPGF
jgi:hypothetical protein